MQVDDLRAALSEAAAVQPPVSPTARRDIRRRVMRRRAAGAALALAVVGGAAAGVAAITRSSDDEQSIHVATHGVTTVPVPLTTIPAVTPTTANGVHDLILPLHHGVPAGFGAVSVTFISANEGWALGAVNCAYGATNCPVVLARTTDGGHTWSSAPPPPTTLAPALDASKGIDQIRFADSQNGWAFGPELWTTHDGGAHWAKSTLTNVYALEAGAGTVHAIALYSPHGFLIESSPVSRDAWNISSTWLGVGAGPIPSVQIVLSGSAGWILEDDRTVIAGARLVNGQWQAWTPPCMTVGGPANLAASSPTDLVAMCNEGVWTGPSISSHLYFSSDGGTTFRRVANPAPTFGSAISPSSTEACVGDSTGIFATFNAGATWRNVSRQSANPIGFTTPGQGVAITYDGQLLMTRDGGHTWAVVPFR
jgi:photosystem II stability/assembly factor-like uncharacterized protein